MDLLSVEDGEVVVGKEAACVPLGADGRAKDNDVLRERAMKDEHASHGSAGVVEHPLGIFNDVSRVGGAGMSIFGVWRPRRNTFEKVKSHRRLSTTNWSCFSRSAGWAAMDSFAIFCITAGL